MRLITCILVGFRLYGQTAVFPGAAATDVNLKVQVNGTQTRLSSALSISALSASVASCSRIVANTLATIDQEIVPVTSCSGTTLSFSSRGFDSTTAASHNSGAAVSLFADAWHHNALRVEIEAIETTILSGIYSTGIAAPLFNCLATGASICLQQTSGTFTVTGAGDARFQSVISNAITGSSVTSTGGTVLATSTSDATLSAAASGLAGNADLLLNGNGAGNNWRLRASGTGNTLTLRDMTTSTTAVTFSNAGIGTFTGVISLNGVTSTNGLITSTGTGDAAFVAGASGLAGNADLQLNGNGTGNNWRLRATGVGSSLTLVNTSSSAAGFTVSSAGLFTFQNGITASNGLITVTSTGDSTLAVSGSALGGNADLGLLGNGAGNNWRIRAGGAGNTLTITDTTTAVTAVTLSNAGVLKAGGYQSSDGSVGVTGASCTAWKNGLCTTL